MLTKPSVKIRTTSSEMFKNISKTIHVSSIMTPRRNFLYCKPNDMLDKKLSEMEKGPFDVIPMLVGGDIETGHIAKYLDQETMKQKRNQGCQYCKDAATEIEHEDRLQVDFPLEKLIIKFLSRTNKPKIPFFVVNHGNRIVGLMTLADLDKVAVKTYLFALISELELSLLDIISKHYESLKTACKCRYCNGKRKILSAGKRKNPEDRLEDYYYLYLTEMFHMITQSDLNVRIAPHFNTKDYIDIVQLRNTVAHTKPLVSGKFPVKRLIETQNLIKSLISACKS